MHILKSLSLLLLCLYHDVEWEKRTVTEWTVNTILLPDLFWITPLRRAMVLGLGKVFSWLCITPHRTMVLRLSKT